MTLRNTVKNMRELLAAISVDLEKAVGGNKAASQRVRTGTIKLEKVAKDYRKQSITEEKKQEPRSRSAAKKPVAKKPVAKKAAAKKKAPAKKAASKSVKARARAKALHKAPAKKKKADWGKRSTAKIPARRR